ncbi:MAG: hypothetical protein HY909_16180 [Deltaproteobacteria bacterium]|nr:hypothetical protein [Deltaproteobacteria bacterium]
MVDALPAQPAPTDGSRRAWGSILGFVVFVVVVLGGALAAVRWHEGLHGAAWDGTYVRAAFVVPLAWGEPSRTEGVSSEVGLAPGDGSVRVRAAIGVYPNGRRAITRVLVDRGPFLAPGVTVEARISDWSPRSDEDDRVGRAAVEVVETAADGARTFRLELRGDGSVRDPDAQPPRVTRATP